MCSEIEIATLSDLSKGIASKPFQFRALVPWVTREIVAIVNWLSLAEKIQFKHIVIGIEFFSLFSLVLVFKKYLSFFLHDKTLSAVLSFSPFYLLPFNFLFPLLDNPALYYPYDIPSILFFTLGMILIYKKKWPAYYLLFPVATFNRETTCFLTIIYLLTAIGKSKPITIFFHCLAQFALWTGIKYYLFYLYKNNPGADLVEIEWQQNLAFFFMQDPLLHYPYFLRTLGYLLVPTIVLNHLIKEQFVRRSLLVIIPFTIGMFIIGVIGELRIWGEMIPVVLPAFILILKELFSRESGPANHSATNTAPQREECNES